MLALGLGVTCNEGKDGQMFSKIGHLQCAPVEVLVESRRKLKRHLGHVIKGGFRLDDTHRAAETPTRRAAMASRARPVVMVHVDVTASATREVAHEADAALGRKRSRDVEARGPQQDESLRSGAAHCEGNRHGTSNSQCSLWLSA